MQVEAEVAASGPNFKLTRSENSSAAAVEKCVASESSPCYVFPDAQLQPEIVVSENSVKNSDEINPLASLIQPLALSASPQAAAQLQPEIGKTTQQWERRLMQMVRLGITESLNQDTAEKYLCLVYAFSSLCVLCLSYKVISIPVCWLACRVYRYHVRDSKCVCVQVRVLALCVSGCICAFVFDVVEMLYSTCLQ